jgi:hypothetical protein
MLWMTSVSSKHIDLKIMKDILDPLCGGTKGFDADVEKWEGRRGEYGVASCVAWAALLGYADVHMLAHHKRPHRGRGAHHGKAACGTPGQVLVTVLTMFRPTG